MVRYSKLPFRQLVSEYSTDLTYTPMMLADVFKHSEMARRDFDTIDGEKVIVQFAASNGIDAADAAVLVAPYSNGVDINCGCPQKWAIHEGIGAHLLTVPDTVCDIIKQVKSRTMPVKMSNGASFPCSIKIRIHPDIKTTVELAQRAEKMGADWITVHGRTRWQRNTEDVDYSAIKLIKESVSIPVIYNGNIFTIDDANEAAEKTGVDGVMAARGLLRNPALYAGHYTTPIECIEKYVNYAIDAGTTHHIFHHHLMYMMEDLMTSQEKKTFNCLYTIPAILDYMNQHYGLFT